MPEQKTILFLTNHETWDGVFLYIDIYLFLYISTRWQLREGSAHRWDLTTGEKNSSLGVQRGRGWVLFCSFESPCVMMVNISRAVGPSLMVKVFIIMTGDMDSLAWRGASQERHTRFPTPQHFKRNFSLIHFYGTRPKENFQMATPRLMIFMFIWSLQKPLKQVPHRLLPSILISFPMWESFWAGSQLQLSFSLWQKLRQQLGSLFLLWPCRPEVQNELDKVVSGRQPRLSCEHALKEICWVSPSFALAWFCTFCPFQKTQMRSQLRVHFMKIQEITPRQTQMFQTRPSWNSCGFYQSCATSILLTRQQGRNPPGIPHPKRHTRVAIETETFCCVFASMCTSLFWIYIRLMRFVILLSSAWFSEDACLLWLQSSSFFFRTSQNSLSICQHDVFLKILISLKSQTMQKALPIFDTTGSYSEGLQLLVEMWRGIGQKEVMSEMPCSCSTLCRQQDTDQLHFDAIISSFERQHMQKISQLGVQGRKVCPGEEKLAKTDCCCSWPASCRIFPLFLLKERRQ